MIVLMSTSLLMALGVVLMLSTMAEARISGVYRQQAEALYAADAALERAAEDVFAAPSWDDVLSGLTTSTFVDGPPGGLRALPGGASLDLSLTTSQVRCGRPACSDADLIAVTDSRPWGPNNPVWQLFAYGPLAQLLPAGDIDSNMYVVVWIADDPSENDGEPLRDGGLPAGCDPSTDPGCGDRNTGRGVVVLMARAIGPNGSQRTIEATLERRNGTRLLSWREIR
jgi:hypothetical protein